MILFEPNVYSLLPEALLFLVVIYLWDTILLLLGRRFQIPDFISHTLTGITLGITVQIISSYLDISALTFFENPILQILVFLGIFLYLYQIGFSFDTGVVSTFDGFIFLQAIILNGALFLLLTVSFLVAGVTANFFYISLVLFSFMPIYIGYHLQDYSYTYVDDQKAFTLTAVKFALLTDILAIVAFSTVHTYTLTKVDYGWIDLGGFFLFLLISVAIFRSDFRKFTSSRSEGFTSNFRAMLSVGFILIVLAMGIFLKLSILFLGLWTGILARRIKPDTQNLTMDKLSSVSSYLCILPFVDLGFHLSDFSSYSVILWFYFIIFLFALIMALIILGIYIYRRKVEELKIIYAIIPRGELGLIMGWLLLKSFPYNLALFQALLMSVLVSHLVGYFMMKVQKSEQ